jgi:hypothetical protein
MNWLKQQVGMYCARFPEEFHVRGPTWLVLVVLLVTTTLITACGGDGDGTDSSRHNTGGSGGTNMARFFLDCDLNGLIGKMIMDVEAVPTSGFVWGPGSNPDITGVIETGQSTLFIEGELTSPTTRYVFTGENEFADFSETTNSFERFRVQWVPTPTGLDMIINPFGPSPSQQSCTLTGSEAL